MQKRSGGLPIDRVATPIKRHDRPSETHVLLIVGAIATLASTWFFDIRSLAMHFWLIVLLAALQNAGSFTGFDGQPFRRRLQRFFGTV